MRELLAGLNPKRTLGLTTHNDEEEEQQQTLVDPGHHSCGAQTTQEDEERKHKHGKTLDVITLDLSGIPLTLKMGNPFTRYPSLLL